MRKSVLVVVALAVAIVACGDSSKDEPEQATAELSPVSDQVREYASTCAEIMIAGEEVDEGPSYRSWVKQFDRLDPPPELREYHDSLTAKYLAKLPYGERNGSSQAAWENEMIIISEMDTGLRDALVDGGCLLSFQVSSIEKILGAKERKAVWQAEGERAQSVEEYAQRCADIRLAAPMQDSEKALIRYMYEEFGKLKPPYVLVDYHNANQRLHAEWVQLGYMHFDGASSKIQRVMREVKALDPSIVDELVRSRCTGE